MNIGRKCMSGRQRGSGRKREILDMLFGNKRRTLLGALTAAVAGTVLSWIFGDMHGAGGALYRPIVMGILASAAVGLVIGLQLFNPQCSANAMDVAELFFALVSRARLVIWLLIAGIGLLFGKDAYRAATVIAEVSGMWCALCLIHNARK